MDLNSLILLAAASIYGNLVVQPVSDLRREKRSDSDARTYSVREAKRLWEELLRLESE